MFGIGGVHWYSIRAQTGKPESYSQEDLEHAIATRTGWSDIQFQSGYAETELTNLILVLGHMRAYGITRVTPLKVNLTLGALVE